MGLTKEQIDEYNKDAHFRIVIRFFNSEENFQADEFVVFDQKMRIMKELFVRVTGKVFKPSSLDTDYKAYWQCQMISDRIFGLCHCMESCEYGGSDTKYLDFMRGELDEQLETAATKLGQDKLDVTAEIDEMYKFVCDYMHQYWKKED